MTESQSRLSATLVAGIWATVLVVTTLLLAWHTLSDRDIWLHERVGRDILAGEGIPRTNTYSFTAPDTPWVDHEWLFQVVVAAVAPGRTGESTDVTGWHLLRTALALGLILAVLLGDRGQDRFRGRHGPGLLWGLGVGLLLGLGLLWTRLILRPELVSYILLVLVIRQVESALRKVATSPRPLLGQLMDPRQPGGKAFLLTVLWAQFHGFAGAVPVFWFLGFLGAILSPVLRAGAGQPPGRAAALALGGAALAILALAATPHGLAGMAYPLRALGQFRSDQPALADIIGELVPLLDTTNALGGTLLLFKLSLVWGVLWIAAQWGRIPLLRVLLWGLAIAIALAGQRGLGPYAVGFMLLHTAPGIGPRLPVAGFAGMARHPRVLAAAAALTAVAAAALVWPPLVDDSAYLHEGVARRFGMGLTPAHAPLDAARWLNRQGAERIAANVNGAGCLLANTDARLWIDGRTEAYPPAAWRAYAELRQGGDAAVARLEQASPDAVCLTTGGPFDPLARALIDDPGWRLAHVGDAAVIFVPEDTPGEGVPPRERIRLLRSRARDEDLPTARRADLCLAASHLARLDGRDTESLAALEQGSRIRPDHAILRHNLGTALLALERFAAAREHFAAALAANPRLADAASNAGVCSLGLDDPDEAVRWFRRALDLDSHNFLAWANLGGVLARQGDMDGALSALTKALELRPDDPRLRAAKDRLQREAGRR